VQLKARELRQRQATGGRQLARDRLDLGDLLGGKTTRATRARLVLQSLKTIVEEPSSPLPHNPRRRVQARRDLGIRHPIRRVEHDPRALHILKRQLLRPRTPSQLNTLLLVELNPVLGRACHRDT
jgi:hypothetical protein